MFSEIRGLIFLNIFNTSNHKKRYHGTMCRFQDWKVVLNLKTMINYLYPKNDSEQRSIYLK